MTPDEAHAYLMRLPRFAEQGAVAYAPGLDRMEALMEAMGRPHRACLTVHVAGTNGKGSTASMVAAIGTALGRRVGLHTSPHLVRLNERMRIDGVPAPDGWIARTVDRYHDAFEAVGPSFFEATVALSLLNFAEEAVDLAVVEVGMGGRLDATNVVHPAVAVITSIGMDHTAFLGDTPAAVAREKAGIVKRGCTVVTGATGRDVLAVVREAARTHHAPLHVVQDETEATLLRSTPLGSTMDLTTPAGHYENIEVGLAGAHQLVNARMAVRTAEVLFGDGADTAAAVRTGLRDVRALSGLRGRLEVLLPSPLVVADVAHNEDGIVAALEYVATQNVARFDVFIGLMQDKDAGGIARLLAEAGAFVHPVEIGTARAVPAEALANLFRQEGVHVESVCPAGGLAEALIRRRSASSSGDVLLVTGSHQVVAHVLDVFGPAESQPPSETH